MEETAAEIAQITFVLAKEGVTMTSIIDDEADLAGKKQAQSYDFTVTDASCRFIYFETMSIRKNPPWLDFVNDQLVDGPITFRSTSQSPNGLLLISTKGRLFAAVFGRSATRYPPLKLPTVAGRSLLFLALMGAVAAHHKAGRQHDLCAHTCIAAGIFWG